MQNATKMGLNCTGAQMSPLDSEEQLKASQEVPPDIPGNEKKLALVRKEKAAANPWGPGATTLEWTLSSPPPFHQFETLPRVQ